MKRSPEEHLAKPLVKRARKLERQQALKLHKQECINDMTFALARGWTIPACYRSYYKRRTVADFHPSAVARTFVTGHLTIPGLIGHRFIKMKLVACAQDTYRSVGQESVHSLWDLLGRDTGGSACVTPQQMACVHQRRVRLQADEMCRVHLLPELAALVALYL